MMSLWHPVTALFRLVQRKFVSECTNTQISFTLQTNNDLGRQNNTRIGTSGCAVEVLFRMVNGICEYKSNRCAGLILFLWNEKCNSTQLVGTPYCIANIMRRKFKRKTFYILHASRALFPLEFTFLVAVTHLHSRISTAGNSTLSWRSVGTIEAPTREQYSV